MNNTIFPIISDFELKLPVYLGGVGCYYTQEHIVRPQGYEYLQWIQCRSGKGKLLIEGKSFIISENQGMLLYPNIPHEYYAVKEPWIVDWVSIGGFAVEKFFMNVDMNKSGIFSVYHPEVIFNKTKRILEIASSDSMMKNLESSKVLYDLLMDIVTYTYTNKDDYIMHQYSKLKPVFNYIDKNYNRPITLEDLSEVSNLTPQYLCTLFKKITGIRVFEYINSTRIKNSKVLILKHREMKIGDIAKMCGYEDVSYFCSVFKRLEKVSPGEFKKLH